MDVPHLQSHPPAPTTEWDKFPVTTSGTPNLATKIEEAGAGGRTARRALVRADSGNAAEISIGPDPDADLHALGAGDTYLIEQPGGSLFTIGNWWVKSASASQGLKVSYV